VTTGYFVVGRVRRAHGIRGELVVETLTDAPDAIFAAGRRVLAGDAEGRPTRDALELRVERSSPFKGGLIVSIEGITDRNTADSWRDRTFLVPEDEIEPPGDDEMFLHDLVGMEVVTASGEKVGSIKQLFELPQGIVFEVERPNKGTVMLQWNDQTVTEVDSEARVVHIDPLEGLLD
jgi:16S rRNA processing protein RimM